MYKITNQYENIINFFSFSNINSLFNLSFRCQSGNNSNKEPYYIPDKELLAKAKKNVREKKKVEAKKKKKAEIEAAKAKKRAKIEAAKEKKRVKAKTIA